MDEISQQKSLAGRRGRPRREDEDGYRIRRAEWLRRVEEGELISTVAREAGRDPKTIRAALALAREDRTRSASPPPKDVGRDPDFEDVGRSLTPAERALIKRLYGRTSKFRENSEVVEFLNRACPENIRKGRRRRTTESQEESWEAYPIPTDAYTLTPDQEFLIKEQAERAGFEWN